MPFRQRTSIARRLRRDASEAEKRLWRALRELPAERRFRRQHPIGLYFVDFACPGKKLAIELDGGQHAAQQQADDARTAEIMRRGYRGWAGIRIPAGSAPYLLRDGRLAASSGWRIFLNAITNIRHAEERP